MNVCICVLLLLLLVVVEGIIFKTARKLLYSKVWICSVGVTGSVVNKCIFFHVNSSFLLIEQDAYIYVELLLGVALKRCLNI